MTGRKKRLIIIALLAAGMATVGFFIYRYYAAPQRKIERLVWELRGCPDGRITTLLARIGKKPNKPEPRSPLELQTLLANYGSLSTPYLIDLARSEENENNHDIKTYALQLLTEVNDPAATEFFRQCLRNKDPSTSKVAAANLKDTCGSQSLLEFTDLLTDPNNLEAAEIIADALGDVGGKQAADLLIGAAHYQYENDSLGFYPTAKDWTTLSIMQSLRKIGDKSVIGPVTKDLWAKLAQIETFKVFARSYYPNNEQATRQILLDYITAISGYYNRDDYYRQFHGGFGGKNPDNSGGGSHGDFGPPPPKFLADPALVHTIATFGGPGEVDLLLALLPCEDMKADTSSFFIINALGDIGDKRAIKPLAAMLKANREQTGYYNVRQAVFRALIRLDARDELIGLLEDNDVNRDNQITIALVELKDKRLLEPLLKTVRYDGKDIDSPTNYIFAVECLGKLGDQRAVEPLQKLLTDGPKWRDIRDVEIQALGMLEGRKALEFLKTLWESPKNPDEDREGWDKVSAAKVALRYGTPEDIKYMLPLITKLNMAKSLELDECLQRNWPKLDMDDAIFLLKSDYDELRVHAARILGDMGDPRAIELLKNALKDKNPNVKYAADEALQKFGYKPADKRIINEAEGGDVIVESPKTATVESLVEIVNTYPHDYFRPSGFAKRKAAIEVVGKIGGPKAIDALTNFLDHGFIDVRTESAKALFRMNDPSVRPALEKAAGDIHWQVRAYASAGLYRLGDKAAIEPVLALLKTRDSKKLSIAVDILCCLKDRQLEKYMLDEVLANPTCSYESYYYSEDFIELPLLDLLVEIGGQEVLNAFQKLRNQIEDKIDHEKFLDSNAYLDPSEKTSLNLGKAIVKLRRKVASATTQP